MNPSHILITLVLKLVITTVVAFVPTSRYLQSSVVINDKIYFLGGINVSEKGTNELFYLNVSLPFSTVNPKWTDLTAIAPIPVSSAFSPSCVGGSNNTTIFLFEHRITNPVNASNLVTFTFDIVTQKWINTSISGITPPPRQEMKAVADKNGRIYISGGYDPFTTQKSYNNTYVLDSVSLTWLSSYPSALIIRSDYTATLLPNGQIVYIGGTNDDARATEIDMTQVTKFLLDCVNSIIFLTVLLFLLDINLRYNFWKLVFGGSPTGTTPHIGSTPPSGSTSPGNNNNNSLMIPLVVGIGGTIVVGIVIAGFICYRKYRIDIRNNPYIATPGSVAI
ncbi:1204_t:CDS:2 [Cetraspora pellucida]|uniref:1204_t:CDS:1 n=1 Tax=Cetraspora pellucida TaxID=1433469 RepID=A0A9N9H4S2_9GLOM|nr:1204_t:CDS:2 [Cetraspora pellucida]